MQGNSFNRLLVSGAARLALRAALLMLVYLSPAVASHAFDLASLFGSGGDSGSGKVAHLEFRLRDGFAPTSIDWSADGKYIATSGTHTGLIHIWDVQQRKLFREIALPNPPGPQFHNLAWSPDGRYLAICNSFDTQLLIYDTSNWDIAKRFGPDSVRACRRPLFSSDGTELTVWARDLVTFSTDDWHEIRRRSSRIFDEQQTRKPSLSLGWDILLRDIAYVPNTHTVVLAGGQYEFGEVDACGSTPPTHTARVWVLEPDDNALNRSFVVHCSATPGGGVTRVKIDPVGQRIATSVLEGTNNNNIRVIDRGDGKLLGMPVDGYPRGVPYGLAYTPDGRLLLVGHDRGNKPSPIYLIDADSLKVLDVVHAVAALDGIAVHPRSTMFAAASFDGITVWKFVSDKH